MPVPGSYPSKVSKTDFEAVAVLANTTESVAGQKLDSGTAAATYAAKNGAVYTGTHDFTAATVAGLGSGGAQPLDSDLTAIAALTTTVYGRSLLTQADASAARTALGLGTAATSASGDFQPVDSDLTAIAALSTTAFGRSFLDRVDASAARTLLGLGTAATVNTGTASGNVALLNASGRYDIARIASGTPTGSLFVRDDGTLALPAGGGGGGSSIGGDAPTSGRFTTAPVLSGTTQTFQVANGQMYLPILRLSGSGTLTSIGTNVTAAGSVGSVIRFGVYACTTAGAVGALLVDAGTAPATSAGAVSVTLGTPLALTSGYYFIAVVPQGGPTTQPTITFVAGNTQHPVFPSRTMAEAVANAHLVSLRIDGTTGALPATPTATNENLSNSSSNVSVLAGLGWQ